MKTKPNNKKKRVYDGFLAKRNPWSEYPIGTKAPAIMGGYWYRTVLGWKWNGPDGSGGTFPTPGGTIRHQIIYDPT